MVRMIVMIMKGRRGMIMMIMVTTMLAITTMMMIMFRMRNKKIWRIILSKLCNCYHG